MRDFFEHELRRAARDLLWLRQQYPAAFSRICGRLTDEDIATLEELAKRVSKGGGPNV